ncbi:phage minor capsid protein [Nonomuraea basaltis]|uniref:phage minor capsid protein n=1 Tax=Nonomuraea basaltis TaxID=2495887 RepID=UPI00110C40D2|nr:phage minor capsid protein [Nonomuraea basaltis]TMR97545.1 hypothetical protein EJK15_17650 [Nonomuraea basaltis]
MADSGVEAVERAIEQARLVADMYEQAELDLLEAIARQVARGVDVEDTETWATKRLGEIQQLRKQAAAILRRMEAAKKAATQAVQDAYRDGMDAAEAEAAAQLADSKARKRLEKVLADARKLGAKDQVNPGSGVNELARQMATMLDDVQVGALRGVDDVYRQVVAFASGSELTGALTFRQVVARALDRFAGKGVKGFTDSANRSWGMREYAEMAIRTATARAARDGHLATLRDAGLDLVMVSNALYSCPICLPWEGEVLAQQGQPGVHRLEHTINDGEMVEVNVRATVPQARAAGLNHPGCHHGFGAYLPGVTRPAPKPDVTATYRDTQTQRRLEREIRGWKRKRAVATDARSRRFAEEKSKAAQEKLQQHLAEKGLRRKKDREQVRRGEPPREPFTAPEPKPDPTPAPPTGGQPPRGDEPTPAAAKPQPGAGRAAVHAGGMLSQDAADRINRARRELPVERDAWLDARSSADETKRRRIDHLIADAEKKLVELRAKRQTKKVKSDIAVWQDALKARQSAAARFAAGQILPGDERNLQDVGPYRTLQYRKDANGALLPPESYETFLDRVMEAGEALHDDLMDAFTRDQRRDELRARQIRARTRQYELDDELNRARGEVKRVEAVPRSEPGVHERDKRLDELYGQRERLMRERDAALADHHDALRELRRREAELVRDLLARVRGMGGRMEAKPLSGSGLLSARVSKVRDDWTSLLAEALPNLPSDWIRRTVGRPLWLGNSRTGRAFQRAVDDLIALPSNAGDNDGAFSSEDAEVFLHELGHRMEDYVPGLRELEYTFVRRRATSNGTLEKREQLKKLHAYSSYASDEVTYRDEWADAYAGKTYESAKPDDPAGVSSEVFQVGLQDVFARSSERFGGIELQRFVLGLLGVL